MASVKFSISLNEELCEAVDVIAKNLFTTRSGVVTMAVREYVAKQKAMSLLGDMKSVIDDFAEKGNLTDEQKQIISDFDNASKIALRYSVQ